MKLDRITPSDFQIQYLNHYRERHSEVDITLGDMRIKPVPNKRYANQQQET